MELPEYQCHKVVKAAKILSVGEIENTGEGAVTAEHVDLILDGIEEPWQVAPAWIDRHCGPGGVLVGGYLVVYDDGYMSWSPADAFTDGYTLLSEMEGPAAPGPTLSPSEAIYAFLGWLTTQPNPITFCAGEDASVAAQACAQFCEAQELPDPDVTWADKIVSMADVTPTGSKPASKKRSRKAKGIAPRLLALLPDIKGHQLKAAVQNAIREAQRVRE